MISKFLILATMMCLANQATAAGLTDLLRCRLSQAVVIRNAENETVRTDHFLVIQNDNRQYATVFVDRKNIGMTSYQRAAKGHQISVMGWSVQLTALLVPEKTSHEISNQRAFTSYVGRLNESPIAVRCAFERRNLQ